jgi:hypothetical protein
MHVKGDGEENGVLNSKNDEQRSELAVTVQEQKTPIAKHIKQVVTQICTNILPSF